MRRFWLLAAATAMLGSAAPLNQDERDRAMSELHATRKMFLDSIAGLSDAQWKFKPAPDRWSIAECAEHITLSEDSLFELVTKKFLILPVKPVIRKGLEAKDDEVLKAAVDRSRKQQAPDFLRPTGRWADRQALIARFRQSRDRAIAFVRDTKDDLRAHSDAGTDAYQILLTIAGHTERHVAQIREVKANPRFPK